jgi:putative ABC transport system permease protein
MTFWTLVLRNLRFHARAHFGVMLGAAIGSAAFIGALVVGDSVRQSLLDRALARLGPIHFALNVPDRLFQQNLSERLARVQSAGWMSNFTGGSPYLRLHSSSPLSTALSLPAIAVVAGGSARANRVNVLGVDPGGWPVMAGWEPRLSWPNSPLQETLSPDSLRAWRSGQAAFINEALARQLSVKAGDEIIVRVRKPNPLALDAAISPRDQDSVAIRLQVGAVLPSRLLGGFALSAQSVPANNVFLPLNVLSQRLAVEGGANLLPLGSAITAPEASSSDSVSAYRAAIAGWLIRHSIARPLSGGPPGALRLRTDSFWFRLAQIVEPRPAGIPVPDEYLLPWLQTQIAQAWLPEDAGLSVRAIEQPQTATGGEFIRPSVEIASARIFLDPAIVSAAQTPRTRTITAHAGYENDTTKDVTFCGFVTNAVPIFTYLANLMSAGTNATPYSMVTAAKGSLVPADMRDDEILVNEWLAGDLQVKPGDEIRLAYYSVDSASRLIERTNSFRVRGVVPLKGSYADRTLMPDFPGVAKAESTQDWDTGFPLIYKIRDKDEAYWRKYRGTPKAFITLAAGQAMWASRFGSLTAIRYEVPTNSFASTYREAVYRNLLANVDPAEVGLRFEPVREQALRAAEQAQDFGQLFLGFSMFLVAAALLLMALLFQFSLEQRVAEVGTLLALGFTPKKVRRLLLLEGIGLALVGGGFGALGGILYAKVMLWGLRTIWLSAVAGTALSFHVTASTLVLGFFSSAVVATLTIGFTLRKQARQPARELLAGELQPIAAKSKSKGFWIGAVSGFGALGMVGWALSQGRTNDAETFFSAGSLLLISGLAFASGWLGILAATKGSILLSLPALGVRSAARRRRRSLATIALLASGAFLISAIGAFRLDANQDASGRTSGTGGFALLGDATLPIVQDLNSQAGREALGLNAKDLAEVHLVPFRVREGDEASCLNLNRAQRPRLLGVAPEMLKGRFTFTDVVSGSDRKQGWAVLSNKDIAAAGHPEEIIVPAVGDANSIQWALGKKIGDTLDFTDDQGRPFKVRIAGAVANSLLQGSLIIDETEFVKRFPSESGYRMFLIDAPANRVTSVSTVLSRALQDFGLELTPAAQRLNTFNAVQNTYLGTFQILGGLGLLLGSAGLGVVVLRNVLERRGELGLLVAVGFRHRQLQWLVLMEHGALLGLGLSLGLVAAAIAVLPALLSPASQLPYRSLAITLAAVLLNGVVCTWVATRVALRGDLLQVLRNE